MSISSVGPIAAAQRELARFWWPWLVAGIFWIVVVLQFDRASVSTVAVLIGILFLIAELRLEVGRLRLRRAVRRRSRALVHPPEEHIRGRGRHPGVLFLLIGIFWIIQAFAEKEFSGL